MSQRAPFKLYSYCHSSASWRVRTVLNLKNLKYDIIPINLLKGEQKGAEYEKVNPNKVVPALVNNDGYTLIESTAIIEYLEELYPNPSVFPKDSIQRAKVRGFSEVVNSFMQPMQNPRTLNRLKNDFGGDQQKWITPWLDHGFQTLETMIKEQSGNGKYCFGDQISLADVYLYPQYFGAARRFEYKYDNFPRIQGVIENLQQVKEFQDAEPKNQPDFPQQ